jgi:hypothetical protein
VVCALPAAEGCCWAPVGAQAKDGDRRDNQATAHAKYSEDIRKSNPARLNERFTTRGAENRLTQMLFRLTA